jgi:hypothetical protein
MNKSMIAGAVLVAGIAIAAPMLAWSAADSKPQIAQAAPDQPGTGPGGRGWDRGDRDRMGPDRGWMHGWWMHRMARLSPQQRCEERLAKRAGMVAYVVAKLNLTADQRPLLDKLQGVMQANADKERQLCATLKPLDERGQETVLDRMNRREQFLTARLQALQQTKPAVQALYQALSPEQKATIDHPFKPR